jgi:hypothetical protein
VLELLDPGVEVCQAIRHLIDLRGALQASRARVSLTAVKRERIWSGRFMAGTPVGIIPDRRTGCLHRTEQCDQPHRVTRRRHARVSLRPVEACPPLTRPSRTLCAAARGLPLVGFLDRRSACGEWLIGRSPAQPHDVIARRRTR